MLLPLVTTLQNPNTSQKIKHCRPRSYLCFNCGFVRAFLLGSAYKQYRMVLFPFCLVFCLDWHHFKTVFYRKIRQTLYVSLFANGLASLVFNKPYARKCLDNCFAMDCYRRCLLQCRSLVVFFKEVTVQPLYLSCFCVAGKRRTFCSDL